MNNVMVSLDWHYRLHYRLIYNPAHFNSFVGLHGAVFLSRDLEVDWHYRLHYRLIYNPAHFNSFVGLHGAVFLSRDLEVSKQPVH